VCQYVQVISLKGWYYIYLTRTSLYRMTNSPELCSECGGNCCRHPNMTDREYQRLVDVIGEKKAKAAGPEQMGTWWMFREKCPGKLPDGCALTYEERPLCCKLYPFVAIPAITGSIIGHELLLDIRHCPRWKEFGDQYEEMKQEFIALKECAREPSTKKKEDSLRKLFRLS
jgi:hypothetical protein